MTSLAAGVTVLGGFTADSATVTGWFTADSVYATHYGGLPLPLAQFVSIVDSVTIGAADSVMLAWKYGRSRELADFGD